MTAENRASSVNLHIEVPATRAPRRLDDEMSLPPRQQAILDQIEQVLQAADPHLKSMFAAFQRSTQAQPIPATEVIRSRLPRRALVLCLVVICMLGVLVAGIRSTRNDCPGLSSDQVVASAAVRYAACSKSTDVWSKGAR